MNKQKVPFTKFKYDGKISYHYKIWIQNIILSILTLGIYSFWGKTKLRKYATASFSLKDNRFEYTGTGGELFKGYIKAMLIFMFFSIIYSIIMQLLYWLRMDMAALIIQNLIPLLFPMLFFAIIYAATRYRFSRVTWHGLRFRLTGSAKKYALIAYGRLILNIITLGYLIPHSQIKLASYMMNNSYYGNLKANFRGKATKTLIKSNIITLLLFIPTLGFSRLWYHAKFLKFQFAHIHIGNLSLASRYTGKKLLKLVLGNMLILIFTLGIGFPIILWRNFKFIAHNMAVRGEITEIDISQATKKTGVLAEGFDDVLDLGTGLM